MDRQRSNSGPHKGDRPPTCHFIVLVLVCRCEALSNNTYRDDVLILAGDISDDQSVLRSTFEIVVQKFKHVFFVPGNHDLWVRRKERDLLDSLGEILPCLARSTANRISCRCYASGCGACLALTPTNEAARRLCSVLLD